LRPKPGSCSNNASDCYNFRRFFPLESAVIISSAFAQAAPSGDPGYIGLLPIVLMFVLLYFLMIRPQMKRAKEQKAMIEALQKGDEVITAGGVLGRITRLSDAYISLEIAPNTEISVQKAAVQVLLPKGTIKSIQ
jgi:preprotein translocase subunit YajC